MNIKKLKFNSLYQIILMSVCLPLMLISCTYSNPVTKSKIINAVRKPDSRIIAVLVEKKTVQKPTGISQFPNGGIPKIQKVDLDIYLFNADTQTLEKLSTIIDGPPILKKDFWPRLKGWEKDNLYLTLSPCNAVSPEKVRHYKIDPTGTASIIKKLPESLKKGNNSPVIELPGEINYTRTIVSDDALSITTQEDQPPSKTLVLRGNGKLKIQKKD